MIETKKYYCFLCYILILLGMSGCYSNRYFGTPDYFSKQPGLLILKSGERIEGEISVNNLLGNSVVVRSPQNKKKQIYRVKDVAACRLDIGIFEPKSIAKELPKMNSQPVFMERLTPDSFSISLYEAYQKQTDPDLMGDVSLLGGVEYDLEYFVHLPFDNSTIVWQISTAILAKHLSNGLDSLFHLCPGLMEKIKSGNPSYDIYFLPQIKITKHLVLGKLSTSAKKEKINKIINVFAEFERCRNK